MERKFLQLAFVFLGLAFFNLEANSQSLVEPDYNGHLLKATTHWYIYYDSANYEADQNFIDGMRPHHAGALTMSDEYLASNKKSNKRLQSLVKGIIHNQTFEIQILDTVESLIKNIDFESGETGWHKVATKGLAQNQRFIRLPMPAIQQGFSNDDIVTAEDVRFAKAMIIHHEGALIMCNDYLNNANSKNGYVKRMCLDILRDQKQEITLMKNIIADYPGNPNNIKIDPSMVHGMDGMMHDMSAFHGKNHH